MTAKTLLSLLLCLLSTLLYATNDSSQPECMTIEYIETLNEEIFEKRIAHIQGKDAIILIALDPIWSLPDFDDAPLRHEEDMANIRNAFKALADAGVDEVLLWKFRRPGLAVPMAFKAGCAVWGGEPDFIDKLVAMHEAFLLISEHGIDEPSVRDSIKWLLATDDYTPDQDKIDKIISKVRPLITLSTKQ